MQRILDPLEEGYQIFEIISVSPFLKWFELSLFSESGKTLTKIGSHTSSLARVFVLHAQISTVFHVNQYPSFYESNEI